MEQSSACLLRAMPTALTKKWFGDRCLSLETWILWARAEALTLGTSERSGNSDVGSVQMRFVRARF